MPGNRFVGLSRRQPVPRLLSVVGKPAGAKDMRDIDVDAPPLSSSDLSDDDGLPTRADIQPSRFVKSDSNDPPPGRTVGAAGRCATARFKRSPPSSRHVSGEATTSSPRGGTGSQKKAAAIDLSTRPPASKKLRRSPPDPEELGSHFEPDLFSLSQKKGALRRYGGPKAFGSGARQRTPPRKGFKQPPKELTPEPESPQRALKLWLPSSPSQVETAESPARKFKAIPDSEPESIVKASPVRKRRLKMPKDNFKVLAGLDGLEESQRPIFEIPDELPESFVEDADYKLNPTVSSTANTSDTSNLPRGSTSPLPDVENLDPPSLCPLCDQEVEKAQLAEFKERYPRMTVSNMQKFCQQHKRRSARSAWQENGYPDIDWGRLDARIARHHALLGRILEGDAPSHYGDLFRDSIRGGRNRTLLRSDANLTPGYYGLRGLRAMSENLIARFSALLRRRALQDRLVSARGHTAYLQSVLVPELAVRLIMEDMAVGEEEARVILTESSWIGELLNDEVADVVLEDADDDNALQSL